MQIKIERIFGVFYKFKHSKTLKSVCHGIKQFTLNKTTKICRLVKKKTQNKGQFQNIFRILRRWVHRYGLPHAIDFQIEILVLM